MKTPVDKRLELQVILEELLGMKHVYFQPPASLKMKYPAIVYSRNDIDGVNANNSSYLQWDGYKVTVIDEDPDSEYIHKVAQLQKCSFSQHYSVDNLNHDVFTLYY